MKPLKITACILTILFLASLSAGASIAAPSDNVISVKEGQTFKITLPSNPSTGYQWNSTYDTTYLELVAQNFQPDNTNPGIVGAGGNEIFTFKAKNPGNTTITFNYQRPWDPTPINTTTYDIRITANNTGNNTNTTRTIPMQDTGVPLAGLTLGILAVLGGIIGSRRK